MHVCVCACVCVCVCVCEVMERVKVKLSGGQTTARSDPSQLELDYRSQQQLLVDGWRGEGKSGRGRGGGQYEMKDGKTYDKEHGGDDGWRGGGGIRRMKALKRRKTKTNGEATIFMFVVVYTFFV